jgi:hypothetical protein
MAHSKRVRFQIAQDDIASYFDELPSKVLRFSGLSRILEQNRDFWRIGGTTGEFIAFLMDAGNLFKYDFKFLSRKEVRYVWNTATDFEIIQSIGPQGYFTHLAAMYLHGLTLQVPSTIYLNTEQTKKKSHPGSLSQQRIDFALSRPCRTSNSVCEFENRRICLLSGMHTGNRGVVTISGDFGKDIRVTDIERTLIDMTVRPVYAGGVHSVLEAYRSAVGKVSMNRLIAMLSKMEYVYPYHQAIGFCMERAGGYSDVQLSLLDRFPMEFDFYLAHDMGKTDYSERWRLHYPKGL